MPKITIEYDRLDEIEDLVIRLALPFIMSNFPLHSGLVVSDLLRPLQSKVFESFRPIAESNLYYALENTNFKEFPLQDKANIITEISEKFKEAMRHSQV